MRLAEAPSHGVPVLKFERHSKGAEAYLALAGEMLNRAAAAQIRGAGMAKLKGLGRGLDALLGGDEPGPAANESLASLAIDALQPGRYQPRLRIDPEALGELAESIKAHGVVQPILVRPLGGGPLRDHRGRAALAGGAPGRAREPCRRWCATCPTGTRSPSR